MLQNWIFEILLTRFYQKLLECHEVKMFGILNKLKKFIYVSVLKYLYFSDKLKMLMVIKSGT